MKKTRIAAAAVLAVLIAREATPLPLNVYKAKLVRHESGPPLEFQDVSVADSGATERAVSVSVSWHTAPDGEIIYEVTLPGETVEVTARIELNAPEGAYWVPFYKKGTSRYRVEFSGVRIEGPLVRSGSIEATVIGVCSIRRFNELIRDALEGSIVSSLEDLAIG